jgi:hypothetical protein
MAPTASKKILLLTNLDRGEANSFLATSQALLTLDPTLDLHVASLKELEEDIKAVWKDTQQTSPAIKPITFHKINGLSVVEGVRQYHAREKTPCRRDGCAESFLRKPGLINTRRAIRDTIPIFVPFSGPQMVQLVQSIIAVIESVNSDLVVVDSLMSAGLTACFHLGIRFACLSPNAIKEFAASDQPGAAGLWKFPA